MDDETFEKQDRDWSDYWRDVFGVVSHESIEEFTAKYRSKCHNHLKRVFTCVFDVKCSCVDIQANKSNHLLGIPYRCSL